MAHNERLMTGAVTSDVFDVFRDGSCYADWVVGTRTITRVEPGWPEPGTAIHWAAGRGPFRKDDVTTSLSYQPDEELRLEAHAWPVGTARIRLAVRAVPHGVVVSIDESPARGLMARLHNPVLDLLIKGRNVETLRRLEQQVRHRQRSRLAAGSA